MFKTAASIVEFTFEAAVVIAGGAAWAIAGFPRLTEVVTVGGLGIACFGAYVAIIWNRDG